MGPATLTVSSPGRICLFGEHQDYLGLPVIAAAISRRISIEGTLRSDNRMVLKLPDIGSEVSFSLGGLIYLESHPQMMIAPLEGALGAFVLGNSGENKNTKGILGRVKAEVSEAAAAARKMYPEFSFHRTMPEQLADLRKRLDKRHYDLLEATFVNRTITLEARKILQSSMIDRKKVGSLLNEHQARLRDVLRISTPKIDSMIEAALKAGALGAKINGSGGGGCMFAYAPENTKQVAEAVRVLGDAMTIEIDRGTYKEPLET